MVYPAQINRSWQMFKINVHKERVILSILCYFTTGLYLRNFAFLNKEYFVWWHFWIILWLQLFTILILSYSPVSIVRLLCSSNCANIQVNKRYIYLIFMEIDIGKNVSLYERKLYVLHIDEVGMLKKYLNFLRAYIRRY